MRETLSTIGAVVVIAMMLALLVIPAVRGDWPGVVVSALLLVYALAMSYYRQYGGPNRWK